MWIYTDNKLAKFHGNILSLSENITKSFRGGATFLTHTVYRCLCARSNEPSGSLDDDEKPLDSESDSLGEYEDQDPSKFNEDGSFIGQYTRRGQPAPGTYNTFV